MDTCDPQELASRAADLQMYCNTQIKQKNDELACMEELLCKRDSEMAGLRATLENFGHLQPSRIPAPQPLAPFVTGRYDKKMGAWLLAASSSACVPAWHAHACSG